MCAVYRQLLRANDRRHNDANVLALGALVTGPGLALEIVDTFLETPFSGKERHRRRIAQVEEG